MLGAEHYPWLKPAHVGLVSLSVTLFVLRGVAVLGGARWPLAPWLRRSSALLDTLLLASGVALWSMLSLQPVRDAWLGTKLLWIVAYIVFGSMALKRAPTRWGKAVCFGAALLCVAAAAITVRWHSAWAPLLWLTGGPRMT